MSGRRLPSSVHPADLALAGGLAALAAAELAWPGGFVGTGPVEGSRPVLALTALAITLPLALRRRFPLATVLVVFLATTLQDVLTVPTDGLSTVVALLVASYSCAFYAEGRRAAVGLAAALGLMAATVSDPGDFAFAVVLVAGAWGAGRLVRRQQLLADALAREQEARARAAVADERARLARELHDVVAHSVSTIVVQAEAGEALLEHDPERARESFHAITGSGRQALAELRRMLGLLRSADGAPDLGPQPGLGQLESLVEQMRAVGLPVELSVEGRPRALPPGVDLSAYRIVQEALTNALKHARPAHARVTVRYGEDDVELEVVDDGDGPGPVASGGLGLAGMRERVRLYGGSLEAGRGSAGGFSVRARLPVGTA
ncbi:MAG TPA: sensor histidine kinase [Gaiellaceae bacterium]|nr:sensor histidine kinase [Gaiellaceae bacterium]